MISMFKAHVTPAPIPTLQVETPAFVLNHHLCESQAVYDITLAFPDKVPQTEKVSDFLAILMIECDSS